MVAVLTVFGICMAALVALLLTKQLPEVKEEEVKAEPVKKTVIVVKKEQAEVSEAPKAKSKPKAKKKA